MAIQRRLYVLECRERERDRREEEIINILQLLAYGGEMDQATSVTTSVMTGAQPVLQWLHPWCGMLYWTRYPGPEYPLLFRIFLAFLKQRPRPVVLDLVHQTLLDLMVP